MNISFDRFRPISEVQGHLAALIETLTEEGPIVITQRGRPVAILLSIAEYEHVTRAPRRRTLKENGDAD
jgi:prevent-host-death family protein